jgi:hypothetical protein
MSSPDPCLIFTQKLHAFGVRYMITGLGDDWSRETLMRLISEHHLEVEWQAALAQTVS